MTEKQPRPPRLLTQAKLYIQEFEERATWGDSYTGPAYSSEEYKAYLLVKGLYLKLKGKL